MRESICVFGFDLTDDGQVGVGTKRRLDKAVKLYRQYEGQIFVAAGKSPYHQDRLHVSMGDVMKGYLMEECGVPEDRVVVLLSRSFDTEGEEEAFAMLPGRKYRVSSWWHLPRVRRLARRHGAKHVRYIPVGDVPSLKMLVLEVGKHVVMLCPKRWQESLSGLAKRLVRTSY